MRYVLNLYVSAFESIAFFFFTAGTGSECSGSADTYDFWGSNDVQKEFRSVYATTHRQVVESLVSIASQRLRQLGD